MKLAIAVVALVGCADSGKTAELAARVDKLEQEAARMRDTIRELNEPVRPPPITISDEAFAELLYRNPRMKILWDWQDEHRAYSFRFEGLLQRDIASLRGWFCGAGGCGRTLFECVSYSRLTVAVRGPNADGSECRPSRFAWCRDKRSQLDCFSERHGDAQIFE